MILARLASSLKRQDWFQVVIEVLIVIVGIFLGLQVSEWNEQRKEIASMDSYYRQIILDLDSDIYMADRAVFIAENNIAAINSFRDAILSEQPEISDANQFMLSILESGNSYFPLGNRDTFDELTSTGNLRLLNDIDLKRRIFRYYSIMTSQRQWDVLVRQSQMEYRSSVSGLITPSQMFKNREGVEEMNVTMEQALAALKSAQQRKNILSNLSAMGGVQGRLKEQGVSMGIEANELKAEILKLLGET